MIMASQPQDHLLGTLQVDDLASMRRVMAATDYQLRYIVLNPMDDRLTSLTNEESIWVNVTCASIRGHPQQCFLLYATLLFSMGHKKTDDEIKSAVSKYSELGPAHILRHPTMYPEEFTRLEEAACAPGGRLTAAMQGSYPAFIVSI